LGRPKATSMSSRACVWTNTCTDLAWRSCAQAEGRPRQRGDANRQGGRDLGASVLLGVCKVTTGLAWVSAGGSATTARARRTATQSRQGQSLGRRRRLGGVVPHVAPASLTHARVCVRLDKARHRARKGVPGHC
jgi:hypothetical protein